MPNLLDRFSDQSRASKLYYKSELYDFPHIKNTVGRFIQFFTHLGVKKGDLVGIFFRKCPNMICAILALVEMDACFLPINLKIPKRRFSQILLDSSLKLIVTDNEAIALLNELICSGSTSKTIVVANIEEIEQRSIYSKLEHPNYGENSAYVMYTSGSTGNPKGILVSYSSIDNVFAGLAETLKLSFNDVFLGLTDYTFDVSLVELLMPFYIGASLFLPEEGTILNAEKIKKILLKKNITLMQATPTTWSLMIASGWRNTEPKLKILSGGEALPKNLANSLNSALNNVWNVYGPTETTMWSSIYHVKPQSSSTGSIPIGQPLKNQQLYIFDQNFSEVLTGKTGELYIGGQGVSKGYVNNSCLTAERFLHVPGKGILYKTGDIVRKLESGDIEYVGRVDNQLKMGGVRIEPAEIEVMLESLPIVERAVALTENTVDDCKRMVAFVQLTESCIENKSRDSKVIEEWGNIYDLAYKDACIYEGEEINPSAWISSFSKKIFTNEELDENISLLCGKVVDLSHKNFLEIGCGTGNLISRLIDSAESYTATEVSSVALDYVKNRFATNTNKIFFKKLSASGSIDYKKYDCIIMNSIIQYFPSSRYLLTAIENQINAIQSGGTVVVGDVRHKDLLDILLIDRNADNIDIIERELYLKSRESELLSSPKFFLNLKNIFNRISFVDINIKSGKYHNELNSYRYDVYLHIEKPIQYKEPQKIQWDDVVRFSLDGLINSLKEIDKPIIVNGIPNPIMLRIKKITMQTSVPAIWSYISRNISMNINYDELQNVDDFIRKLDAADLNFFTEYEASNPAAQIRIKIYPRSTNGCLVREQIVDSGELTNHAVKNFVREPYTPCEINHILHSIKDEALNQLHDYMQPVHYYVIEKWPTTVNGKIDRKALVTGAQSKDKFSKNSICGALLAIWESITGQIIKVDQPFGTLGVSSLYFYYFVGQIQKILNVNLSFSLMSPEMSMRTLSRLIQSEHHSAIESVL